MEVVKFIRDAAQDYSVPLEAALLKCMVLASDMDYEPLLTWATCEVEGYENAADIPEYRAVSVARSQAIITNGVLTDTLVIGTSNMDAQFHSRMTRLGAWQPVSSIEHTASLSTTVVSWPDDLKRALDSQYPKHWVKDAWYELSPSSFVGILSVVRSRILRFSFALWRLEQGADRSNPQRQSATSEQIGQLFQDIIINPGSAS